MKQAAITRRKILKKLKQSRGEMRKRFSVKKIGLFGSYMRGDARPQSDIDLLVEFTDPTFDNYMDLKFFLEDLFSVKVDLVMADAVKPRLKPYINQEVVYV